MIRRTLRDVRFVFTNFALQPMDVTTPHVWRVADNEFELTDRGIHDIHAHETYGSSQRRGIYARDLKRCLGNVAREDFGPWNFQCQCDCNTSRSCADVQNARMGSLAGGLVDLEDGFDDVLGLGPRNQDSG